MKSTRVFILVCSSSPLESLNIKEGDGIPMNEMTLKFLVVNLLKIEFGKVIDRSVHEEKV